MKKFLLFIFGILVFGVIGILDMFGVSALTYEASFNKIEFRQENSTNFTNSTLNQIVGNFSNLGEMKYYYSDFNVKTNASTSYYTIDNELRYTLSSSLPSCESDYCQYDFFVYGSSLEDRDVLENAEFFLTKYYSNESFEKQLSSYSDNSTKCYVTDKYEHELNNDFTYKVRCVISDSNPQYLLIRINSEPYKNYISSSTYDEYQYVVAVSSVVNYDVSLFPLPQLSYEVDEGNVMITVDNYDEFISNSEFWQFNITSDLYQNQLGVNYSRDQTYTFENLPNGTYTFSLGPCATGRQCSQGSSISIDINDSVAPVVSFTVSDSYENIIVDASSSYSDFFTISKYYYQINDEEWIESSQPTYIFENRDYGQYSIRVRVEDSEGNSSATYTMIFVHKSEEQKNLEQNKGFFDTVIDWFNGFWDGMINAILSIFIPDEEVLSETLNTIMISIEDQFGFLSYPFTWILTFLENFLTLSDSGSYLISWPAVKVPNFDYVIIEAGSFDLATLLQDSTINAFHEIYLIFIDALILISFFNLCLNKLNQYFGGEEFTTEVLVDSDSYSYVDDLGTRQTVTSSKTRSKRRRSL